MDAQRRVAIGIELPPEALVTREAPLITLVSPLAGSDDEELIRSGFPARLRFVAEVWPSSGLFKRMAGPPAEWNVIVKYEPLDRVFQVVRIAADGSHPLGTYASFAQVRTVLSQSYRPLIRPPQRSGRYFYSVRLEITKITSNDLDEISHWTEGELRPAIRGERNAGSTVISGLGTIVKHLIGAQTKKYRAQSRTFQVR